MNLKYKILIIILSIMAILASVGFYNYKHLAVPEIGLYMEIPWEHEIRNETDGFSVNFKECIDLGDSPVEDCYSGSRSDNLLYKYSLYGIGLRENPVFGKPTPRPSFFIQVIDRSKVTSLEERVKYEKMLYGVKSSFLKFEFLDLDKYVIRLGYGGEFIGNEKTEIINSMKIKKWYWLYIF